MKKPQGTIDEGETVSNSPLRKNKNETVGASINREKVLNFHQELVRGLNIVRSMGLNNERLTPLFSFFVLKTISERMKKFREEELSSNQP